MRSIIGIRLGSAIYVLEANPPLGVMDGFCRRMWKTNVDKVGLPRHGVFLVRFHSTEFRDQVVNGGYLFFNNRPVIMKNWTPDLDLKKNDVTIVPIWVHLENLDLKYWGERSLFKIVRQLGEPNRVDVFTRERNRLSYPRVLIDVRLNQDFTELLYFEDEN